MKKPSGDIPIATTFSLEGKALGAKERQDFRDSLAPRVAANEELVRALESWIPLLRDAAGRTTVVGTLSADLPPWKEPRRRDLEAIAAASRRLTSALDRVHPAMPVWALSDTDVSPEALRVALSRLASGAEDLVAVRDRERARSKAGGIGEKRELLERVVMAELRRHGIRLTKSRDGDLARTLIAMQAATTGGAPEDVFHRLDDLLSWRRAE